MFVLPQERAAALFGSWTRQLCDSVNCVRMYPIRGAEGRRGWAGARVTVARVSGRAGRRACGGLSRGLRWSRGVAPGAVRKRDDGFETRDIDIWVRETRVRARLEISGGDLTE